MSDDLLLTRAEAAARLGVSERTVYRRLRAARVGPALRRGQLRLYAAADIDRLAHDGDPATVAVTAMADMALTPASPSASDVADRLAAVVADISAAYTAALVARDEHLADLERENAALRAAVARLSATSDTTDRRPWWRRWWRTR